MRTNNECGSGNESRALKVKKRWMRGKIIISIEFSATATGMTWRWWFDLLKIYQVFNHIIVGIVLRELAIIIVRAAEMMALIGNAINEREREKKMENGLREQAGDFIELRNNKL